MEHIWKVGNKKFIGPFVITYILLSVAINFYPSFNFYSLKGQLLLLFVSFFNGILGMYVKKI